MKSTVFWDITPCSPLKANRRSGGTYTYLLHLQGQGISRARNQREASRACLPPASTLISCSAYSLTQKMEAICSTETSVDFHRTTRRFIPEDSITLYNHRCENLKSCVKNIFWDVTPCNLVQYKFQRNVDQFGPDCMAPRPIRWYFS
jgi:hypothetical protein